MREHGDALCLNHAFWQEQASRHAQSPFYDVDTLVNDRAKIPEAIRLDRPYLEGAGIEGGDVIHLQCYIGTDTVGLARLGAHRLVGLDFSEESLEIARGIADRAGLHIDYVCSDVLSAHEAVEERFDIVYTSEGALAWVPDIRRWAHVVASLLKPGGTLVVRDVHPLVGTLKDPVQCDALELHFPYFETREGITWDDDSSEADYAGSSVTPGKNATVEWNHSLGQIVNALSDEGVFVKRLDEIDELFFPMSPDMKRCGPSSWKLPESAPTCALPLSFRIVATADLTSC